jgi:Arc/MetJ family transcription regulator
MLADVAKRKTTVYVDDEVLRATRIRAARAGKRDSEVVEEALRAYLGFDAIESVWARSRLSEKEALSLAYDEIHASRKPRRGSSR